MASARGAMGVQEGCSSGRFKRALLRNLILGLWNGGAASREMGFQERKSAIKRAADAALASARGAAPCWSRFLAAELAATPPPPHRSSSGPTSSGEYCCNKQAPAPPSSPTKMIACKKILRRSLRRPRPPASYGRGGAGVLARAMVRKRTSVLKEIVPGGKALDLCTLLGETLDYALSLKAQVDAMQLLVRTLQEAKHK